jgi:hypothetical protein
MIAYPHHSPPGWTQQPQIQIIPARAQTRLNISVGEAVVTGAHSLGHVSWTPSNTVSLLWFGLIQVTRF